MDIFKVFRYGPKGMVKISYMVHTSQGEKKVFYTIVFIVTWLLAFAAAFLAIYLVYYLASKVITEVLVEMSRFGQSPFP